jgi:hypothetical protein
LITTSTRSFQHFARGKKMKVPGNMLLTITIVPTVRSDVVVQVLQVDRTGDR